MSLAHGQDGRYPQQFTAIARPHQAKSVRCSFALNLPPCWAITGSVFGNARSIGAVCNLQIRNVKRASRNGFGVTGLPGWRRKRRFRRTLKSVQ
jgi:hypothetical protein